MIEYKKVNGSTALLLATALVTGCAGNNHASDSLANMQAPNPSSKNTSGIPAAILDSAQVVYIPPPIAHLETLQPPLKTAEAYGLSEPAKWSWGDIQSFENLLARILVKYVEPQSRAEGFGAENRLRVAQALGMQTSSSWAGIVAAIWQLDQNFGPCDLPR